MADEQDVKTTPETEPGIKQKKAKKKKKSSKRRARPKTVEQGAEPKSGAARFPRHSVSKALRIPRAVLDQNAGRACSDQEALKYAGLSFNGPSRVELSS